MKTPTKDEAKRASEALHKLRDLYRNRKISYDAAKEFASPHAKIFDQYLKASYRSAGLPARGFSFAAFMR